MPGCRKSIGGAYLTSFQTRIGARNDLGTWTYSPTWTTISNDWNGIEVEYLRGTNSGEMRLWVNGVLAQTLTVLDTDTIAIDSVQLGVMGVDSGTRGTLYLDDFTSTRFSTIGMLPDPGVHEELPVIHTYTSQPDGSAGVDTFINSSGSTSNYGTIDYMWVGYSSDTNGKYRSLIKFNLASIPANATITSATLILRLNYQGGTTANTMSVYPLLKNWTETGVTWNRYDGTNNWQTAGAGGATDRDNTSMGSRGFVSSESVGFKAIPLDISIMQNYVNGTRANYGWILKMDTESGYLYEFTSSDRYIVANRPQLVVEYTLPEEEPDWINKTYTYEDEDHIHAVTSLVVTDENDNQTTNSYRYDENGNMICRIEGGETFLQAYNTENRMSGVLLVTGDCDTLGDTLKAWQFTYDGDGVKVKQEYTDSSGTLTTYYYAGGSYEVQTDGTTETVRQYYAIAGVTVGMRAGETFYYFLTDHLGSVVGVTDSTGVLVSSTRYTPFGEVRTDVGTISQTDYGYTFQKKVSGMGLMDYKARYYSTLLGRFVQPDTIIPGAGNPQTANRYGYVVNNPISFIDPSGNSPECIYSGRTGCLLWAGLTGTNAAAGMENYSNDIDANASIYGVTISDEFTTSDQMSILYSIGDIADSTGGLSNFSSTWGGVYIQVDYSGWGGHGDGNNVWLNTQSKYHFSNWTIAHEFGHAWDFRNDSKLSKGIQGYTGGVTISLFSVIHSLGLCTNTRRGCNDAGYFYGGVPAKGSDSRFNRVEDFAESFAAYIYIDQANGIVSGFNTLDNSHLYYSNYSGMPRWVYINNLINGINN